MSAATDGPVSVIVTKYWQLVSEPTGGHWVNAAPALDGARTAMNRASRDTPRSALRRIDPPRACGACPGTLPRVLTTRHKLQAGAARTASRGRKGEEITGRS